MDSRVLYSGLIALVVSERLGELVRTRRNVAWSLARGGVEHGQAHYPVMVVLHVGLLVGCLLEPWLGYRPFVPWIGWPALVIAIGCQAIRGWCIHTLGPRWNTRIITVPDMPLITTGPYQWLRHPNYLAVVVEGIALPLIHTAWVTALSFTAANWLLLRHRIRIEDRALSRQP